MLHADNFLTFVLGDGVPNGHVVRRQVPGKRTRRSLTYSPRLGELLAGEGWRVITGARVALNAPFGYDPPHFSPQSLQLSFQSIELGAGDADQFGCFSAHARLLSPAPKAKCRTPPASSGYTGP